jgi:hypothetical protein
MEFGRGIGDATDTAARQARGFYMGDRMTDRNAPKGNSQDPSNAGQPGGERSANRGGSQDQNSGNVGGHNDGSNRSGNGADGGDANESETAGSRQKHEADDVQDGGRGAEDRKAGSQ